MAMWTSVVSFASSKTLGLEFGDVDAVLLEKEGGAGVYFRPVFAWPQPDPAGDAVAGLVWCLDHYCIVYEAPLLFVQTCECPSEHCTCDWMNACFFALSDAEECPLQLSKATLHA